jgi:hypothetical protein
LTSVQPWSSSAAVMIAESVRICEVYPAHRRVLYNRG